MVTRLFLSLLTFCGSKRTVATLEAMDATRQKLFTSTANVKCNELAVVGTCLKSASSRNSHVTQTQPMMSQIILVSD